MPSLEEVEYIFDLNLVPAGPNQWGAEFIDFNYRAHFEGGFSGLDLADQRYWTSTANGDSTSAAYYHVSSGFGAFRIEGGGGIAGELQSVTNPSACRCVKDLE